MSPVFETHSQNVGHLKKDSRCNKGFLPEHYLFNEHIPKTRQVRVLARMKTKKKWFWPKHSPLEETPWAFKETSQAKVKSIVKMSEETSQNVLQ